MANLETKVDHLALTQQSHYLEMKVRAHDPGDGRLICGQLQCGRRGPGRRKVTTRSNAYIALVRGRSIA